MRYVIGLDVGIGSVGWSAVQYDEPRRILDFGVRAFESGELERGKSRTSQERRRYRAARRLVRRRSHRKHRIKAHLDNIGLIDICGIEAYFHDCNNNIMELRAKGLDDKLTPAEIAACLINFCNKRGYQDFYEMDESMMSAEEKKNYLSERKGAEFVDSMMSTGKYRTVAEMILNEEYFNGTGNFRSYRNNSFREEILQINRNYLKHECELILAKQAEYYPKALSRQNIETAIKIIFDQRCFEEGPGNDKTPFRRYTGFLDTYGNCRFYPEEKRGCRFTVLADIYSLVNTLSQYRYFSADGSEGLNGALASEFIKFALENGNLTVKDVKAIAKSHKMTLSTSAADKRDTLAKALKYIKVIKPIFDSCGLDWKSAIDCDWQDSEAFLNRLGKCLSENQTPRRRIDKLREFPELNEEIISRLAAQKFSGTSNVSDKHMIGAVEAFMHGEAYGSYQANIIKEAENRHSSDAGAAHYKLPSFEEKKEEFEFYKNPVVCRAINETRKIINVIISVYGSPYAINIEVASDLNRCFDDRMEIEKAQKANEKNKNRIKGEIAKLLGCSESEVTGRQTDCYLLGEQQGWKCMYSGREINMAECLSKNNRTYEIDHIVPYSLILDNTLHNKALVFASENQLKKQRTPLMYLSGDREAEFIGRVQTLYKGDKISKKKYDYLLQPDIYGDILSEWKTRNINDTRYISKFLVRYLSENLLFNNEVDEKYRRTEVYAVKGAVTSQMRRLWLNEKTWGKIDKAELKSVSLLDHAADAVVLACCIPSYVEIASVQNKLRNIYKRAGKKETDEYRAVFEDCLKTMTSYHGMKRDEVTRLLRSRDRTPCLIPNLREEVDIRFIEPYTFREMGDDEQKNMLDEEIYARYHEKCREFYNYDIAFADSLQPVIVSHKQSRKASGEINEATLYTIKEVNGENVLLKRKKIADIKKKEIPSIYSNDTEMIHCLEKLMEPFGDKSTVQDALNSKGLTYFSTPNGRRINKVRTIISNETDRIFVKNISENNYSNLKSEDYYCLELYKDINDNLNMTGIAYSDLVKKNGKLYLSEKYNTPSDYKKHEMYLFKWDYIFIYDKNSKCIFNGYAVGSAGVKDRRIGTAENCTTKNGRICIPVKGSIKKYEISILGKMGGEIKCGEPLLSITERS